MSTPSRPTLDCTDFVLEALDWLESRDSSPESIDRVLDLLADQRRRLFLEVMRTYGEPLTLPDAAEEVTSREVGKEVPAISAERVANVYISLYHDHLPQLVDAGLLEYDQERDLVAPLGI